MKWINRLQDRVAVAADEARLLAFQAASLRIQGRGHYARDTLESFLQHVGTLDAPVLAGGQLIVLELDGELIGCGGWSWHRDPSTPDFAARATVCGVYVDPAYVRRGVGTRIVRMIERELLAQGSRQADVTASLMGVPFYERLGYEIQESTEIRLPTSGPFVCRQLTKALTHMRPHMRAAA